MIDEERIDEAVEEELCRRSVHEGLAPPVALGASALTVEEHERDVAQLRSELREEYKRQFAAEEKRLPEENETRH